MANDRNAGAKKKFPLIETKHVQIKRIVPKDLHDEIKKETNHYIDSLLINKLQTEALDKCVMEALKNR